jgi:hypothetical protein
MHTMFVYASNYKTTEYFRRWAKDFLIQFKHKSVRITCFRKMLGNNKREQIYVLMSGMHMHIVMYICDQITVIQGPCQSKKNQRLPRLPVRPPVGLPTGNLLGTALDFQ